MGLTWQGDAQRTGEDEAPGPYAHAPAMWRQYDCLVRALADALAGESCRWDDVDRHASELADLVRRRGWRRAVPHTIGEQEIERIAREIGGGRWHPDAGAAARSLRGYNAACREAVGRKRAPR